ncbi:MAG: hypothetical protein HZB15_14925 [Actinobacteria bacterium]|nr:hypothetical protein [Actinomycetota bacterium]
MERRSDVKRSRWAALGAAVAVAIGGGGFISGTLAAPASGPGSTGSFKSIAPVRILDTRPAPENVGGIAGPVGPNSTITLKVGGVAPVPANAIAVVMNVTVTGTTASSFLTVWPSDQARPTASNLNWTAGEAIPNLVTVQLAADGGVSFYNLAGQTDVVVDVAGYYLPSSDKFISLPITGMTLNNASISEALPGGIRLADNGFGTYAGLVGSFVLPPDFTPGSTARLSVMWSVPGACSIALQANNLTVTRPGIAQITGPSTSSGLSVGSSTSTAPNITSVTTATITSPSASTTLQPGDTVLFGLFRRGDDASDTCAGMTAIVTGISVSYD